MAESFFDDQNAFNCPVCLDVLKDPVTTACGHSFCMGCIEECWDQEDQKGVYSCPQCRQTFNQRPTLSKNTTMADLVKRMVEKTVKSKKASPTRCFAGPGDVACDVCMGKKLKAIKSCLVCLASYCESHIQTHYTSPALKRHKLINASPHLQDQICSQHDKPLELYCSRDEELICVQCALINHQNHQMSSPAAQRQQQQGQLKSNQNGLLKDMQQREKKVQELKQAMGSHKCSAQTTVELGVKIFTELISSMENSQDEVTEMIRAQEKAEVSKLEKLIQTLEQEISDLKRRNDELEQLSQVDDDIYFIQNFSSLSRYQYSNLNDITVNQHLTFKEIETIICELKSQLDDMCEHGIVRISEKVPTVHIMVNKKKIMYLPTQPKTREEFMIYSSKLSLNSSTACKQLSVSNNNVRRSDSSQNKKVLVLSRNYDEYQYDSYTNVTYQVLCNERLSGRCYFEIQWSGKGCSIGFSYDSFRKAGGDFTFGCNNRSWRFDFSGNACLDITNNKSKTNIPIVSSKIRVYLDHSAGTLSFYSITDKMSLLHRIQTRFTEPLYPGFSFQKWETGSSVNIIT